MKNSTTFVPPKSFVGMNIIRRNACRALFLHPLLQLESLLVTALNRFAIKKTSKFYGLYMQYSKRHLSAIFLFMQILCCLSIDCKDLYCSETNTEMGTADLSPLPHILSLGPEAYHVQRTRVGGTKQQGWLYGLRINYDYIKRYHIYWGLDAHWAKGTLNGHNGGRAILKSSFSDAQIEGRLGYTFQAKCLYQPSLTPFLGYGYFKDCNDFRTPSPLPVKFTTTYRYISYGFLASIAPTELLNLGLNFKSWSMIHARVKVHDDPEEENVSMLIGERFNYRIELPVVYRFCSCNQHLEIGISPFYELRHYGERENFPFDFLDTKFRLWGCTLQLSYRL